MGVKILCSGVGIEWELVGGYSVGRHLTTGVFRVV